MKRITIKVGSNVIAAKGGGLDLDRLNIIVDQIAAIRNKGDQVVLVSSGAVAAGKGIVQAKKATDTIAQRQLWSSVGQVHLVNAYTKLLDVHNLKCAQLLVTKEDFRDRTHYLNLKNCITVLLDNDIIPILNENDAISVTELMFTDNDELSGMIASMTDSEKLFILTNVNGIYDGDPSSDNAQVIRKITSNSEDVSKFIQTSKSSFGRGGMITKYHIARKVANEGIDVYIANGLNKGILTDIIYSDSEKIVYSHFVAESKASTVKKWIAHSDGFEKGIIVINPGARDALFSKAATSLLPVGITEIEGDFLKGDIVKIVDQQKQKVGFGRAMYGSDTAKQKIGKKGEKPFVHYDYLFLEF